MDTLRDYSLCHRQSHGADCRSYIADIDSLHCVQLRWEASTSTIGRYPVGFRSLSRYWQLLTHIHIDKYNYELVSLVTMHASVYVHWCLLYFTLGSKPCLLTRACMKSISPMTSIL